ncbi:hypothetical protein KI387_024304, partial [Taxus chinensis]
MCGGPEHPEPNGVCDAGTTSVAEKENDHTGMNKLKDVGNVYSSLLESAENNDLIGLKQTLKEDVLKITEVSLWYGRKHVSNQMNEGLSRGFSFLEFGTHMDAMNAYKRLQNPNVIFGGDRTAKFAFAEPLREPNAEVMAQ